MTRNYVSCLSAILIGCLAWMLASCSSDAELYDYVSANDAMVARMDLTTVIDNTGSHIKSGGVELSPSLQKLTVLLMSGRDREHFDNLLAVQGVDLSNIVVSVDSHMEATVTIKVTDHKKFKEYLQNVTYGDVEESEEKGYTVYRLGSGGTIFVTGNTACALIADRNVDVSDVEARKEAAKAAPLQPWQKKCLAEGKTFNMLMNLAEYVQLARSSFGSDFNFGALKAGYDDAQLTHAFAKVNFTLEGLELSGTVAMVDADDKPLVSKYAGLKVDTSLLKYASADDMFVTMAAVPGTIQRDDVLNQMFVEMGGYRQFGIDRETVATISNVLSDVDGTVMLAAGPKNMLKINTTAGWDAVMAVQMKPGMAGKYINQIKSLIDATNTSMTDLAGQYAAIGYRGYKPKTVAYTETDSALVVTVPQIGEIYVKVIGNTLIASLSPVSERGDCTIAAGEFAGMSSGTIVRVPRRSVLSSIMQLPFGIDISYVSDSQTAHLSVRETDAEGRMLENVIKLVAGQSR